MFSVAIVIAVLLLSSEAATTKKPTTKKPTTKNPPLCGVCLPRSVTLVPADGTPGSITPTIKMLVNDSRGCRRMYVICNTPAGYTKSNMVVSNMMNEQTDYPLVGKNVRALVTCFKASWTGDLRPYYNLSIEWLTKVRCYAT